MGQPIRRHGYDHQPGGQDSIWGTPAIYIGTLGDDGADDFLNANPPPFNPSLEGEQAPGYPAGTLIPYVNIPFQNGWTNYLNGYSPVWFMVNVEGFMEIHGPITGGSPGSVVFTLPNFNLDGTTPLAAPPTYWTPTPSDPSRSGYALGDMGSYWPLAPKALEWSLVDGSGSFTYSVDTSGNVTYIQNI